ncbi:MAG: DUF202 domain-containing protein [Chitinispirillaceae bacterium]|nr:DUF202 domain-containing protein [Chitinispirillaceae bacterium]
MIIRDYLAAERTHLANERTHLAYLRTSVILLVMSFTILKSFESSTFLIIISIIIGLLSVCSGIFDKIRYIQTRQKL